MKRLLLLVPLVVALVLGGSAAGLLPRVSAADPGACDPTDARCLARETDRLAADLGPRGALERLRVLSDERIEIDYRCHSLVHRIGLAALEREGNAATALLAAGAELRTCSDGYIHGVMLGALGGIEGEAVATTARSICADPEIAAAIGGVLSNCLHGAGHGILSASGGEIELAIERCADAFGAEPFVSDYGPIRCANGVFMEALIPTLDDRTIADPLERCDAIPAEGRLGEVLWLCYLNAADAASRASAIRPDPSMVERCAVVRAPYVESCIDGALSHPSDATSAAALVEFCEILGDPGIPGSAAEHCLESLIGDVSIHHPEDPRAIELCAIATDRSRLFGDRDTRLVGCVRDYLVGVVDYWGDDGRVERICAQLVEPALVTACRAPLPEPAPED
jgi:hypothetical protein